MQVDDDTNSGICASSSKVECFFQVLAVHGKESYALEIQSIYFHKTKHIIFQVPLSIVDCWTDVL